MVGDSEYRWSIDSCHRSGHCNCQHVLANLAGGAIGEQSQLNAGCVQPVNACGTTTVVPAEHCAACQRACRQRARLSGARVIQDGSATRPPLEIQIRIMVRRRYKASLG